MRSGAGEGLEMGRFHCERQSSNKRICAPCRAVGPPTYMSIVSGQHDTPVHRIFILPLQTVIHIKPGASPGVVEEHTLSRVPQRIRGFIYVCFLMVSSAGAFKPVFPHVLNFCRASSLICSIVFPFNSLCSLYRISWSRRVSGLIGATPKSYVEIIKDVKLD